MILDCLGKAVRRHTRSKLSIKSDTNSGNSPAVFLYTLCYAVVYFNRYSNCKHFIMLSFQTKSTCER